MFDRWNQSVPAMVAFTQQREKAILHSFDDIGETAGPVRTDCGFALKNRRCSGFFRCTFFASLQIGRTRTTTVFQR